MWLLGINAFLTPHRVEAALDEHSAIVDAIEAHNPADAVKAVKTHICNSLDAVRHSWLESAT